MRKSFLQDSARTLTFVSRITFDVTALKVAITV